MTSEPQPTAGIVLIGNELLSGKTQDANLKFLGGELARVGIKLVEARVVRDEYDTIGAVVREFSERFTYVFTTGGIGPTHDDITAEAVARAFAAPLRLNDDAVLMMKSRGREMNEARLKMAMIPEGATLVANSVSLAPGFRIRNVFVLAGIPKIAEAMFFALEDQLEGSAQILSKSLDAYAPEGDIALPLEAIANARPAVEIGSYPFSRDGRFGANLVVRGTDPGEVTAAIEEIARVIGGMGVVIERQG